MSGYVSTRTAELSLIGLRAALLVVEHRRNGQPLPADIRLAVAELKMAAIQVPSLDLPSVDHPHETVPAFEEIDVATTAERLGITPRAVRLRLETGTLAGHRGKGRTWIVHWPEEA